MCSTLLLFSKLSVLILDINEILLPISDLFKKITKAVYVPYRKSEIQINKNTILFSHSLETNSSHDYHFRYFQSMRVLTCV